MEGKVPVVVAQGIKLKEYMIKIQIITVNE